MVRLSKIIAYNCGNYKLVLQIEQFSSTMIARTKLKVKTEGTKNNDFSQIKDQNSDKNKENKARKNEQIEKNT